MWCGDDRWLCNSENTNRNAWVKTGREVDVYNFWVLYGTEKFGRLKNNMGNAILKKVNICLRGRDMLQRIKTGLCNRGVHKRKRKRSDLVLWQTPLYQQKIPRKNQSYNTNTPTKKNRLHNDCGPTDIWRSKSKDTRKELFSLLKEEENKDWGGVSPENFYLMGLTSIVGLEGSTYIPVIIRVVRRQRRSPGGNHN